MTDDITRFKRLKRVFVGPNETDVTETTVSSVIIDRRGVRLRFAVATDKTSAEKLRGALVYVDEADPVRLPKGTFFAHDLLGMNVVDDRGHPIGFINDVLKYPAHDVYVVDSNGREIMLPAVKECIRKIDRKSKTMTVHLIEGMLDDSTPEKGE